VVRSRSRLIWGCRVVALLGIVGLVAYLVVVGLNEADEIAGVLGLLVSVAALLAPYLLPPGQGSPAGLPTKPERSQSVVNSVVQGDPRQVKGGGRGRVPDPAASVVPATAPPPATSVPGAPGGQYVSGSWVGGNLTQVDGVDGDVSFG
jgi:hypothetical protein